MLNRTSEQTLHDDHRHFFENSDLSVLNTDPIDQFQQFSPGVVRTILEL